MGSFDSVAAALVYEITKEDMELLLAKRPEIAE